MSHDAWLLPTAPIRQIVAWLVANAEADAERITAERYETLIGPWNSVIGAVRGEDNSHE